MNCTAILNRASRVPSYSWLSNNNKAQLFSTFSFCRETRNNRLTNVYSNRPNFNFRQIKPERNILVSIPSNSAMKFGTAQQPQFSSNFFFRQLFDRISCTYTYLLADSESGEAVLIDPVIELAERDVQTAKDLGLTLKYVINTHCHADHITGTGLLKKLVPETKSVIAKHAGATADVYVGHGDILEFGKHQLEVASTPGHTSGCLTYICKAQSCAFTGDAVLIRGCGRTDFQEGDPALLYDSVWNNIFSLPEDFRLYPAHDYKGQTSTSVAEEKSLNPRLTRTKEEFVKIMENLNLDYPKQIDVALPANQVCGLYNLPDSLKQLLDEKK